MSQKNAPVEPSPAAAAVLDHAGLTHRHEVADMQSPVFDLENEYAPVQAPIASLEKHNLVPLAIWILTESAKSSHISNTNHIALG